jgi:ubiquitin fusion degradation protein 1
MYFGNLQEMYGMLAASQQRNLRFDEQYRCYSMAMSGKGHLEDGDKILLPPSALDTLARMNVEYPMLFELSTNYGRRTHSGVLEFSAEEGRVYIPFWMMTNLFIEEGSLISVKNVSLPKAQFVKFRAQSVDFLDISNPRAVLEVTLRKFTCVTVGDQIKISHAGKDYFLELVEVQPDGY